MPWWQEFFDEAYVEAFTAAGMFDDTAAEVDALCRLLGVPPGAAVLDVACGFGRVAGPLHQRGYRVTGVDASATQLRLAAERNPGPDYVHGDMRQPPPGPFDAVVNLFSSFGYFADPAEDRRALQAWHDVLRPGGVLVVHLTHRDRVAYLEGHRAPIAGTEISEESETDWVAGIRTSRLSFRGVTRTFRVRLYTPTELVGMLQAVGFRAVDAYGGFGLGPVSPRDRLVLRATR